MCVRVRGISECLIFFLGKKNGDAFECANTRSIGRDGGHDASSHFVFFFLFETMPTNTLKVRFIRTFRSDSAPMSEEIAHDHSQLEEKTRTKRPANTLARSLGVREIRIICDGC